MRNFMMPLKRVKKAYQKNQNKNLTNQFQKFNKNKKLSTMINNERYTLNDVSNLITKTDEKNMIKIMPLKNAMIW